MTDPSRRLTVDRVATERRIAALRGDVAYIIDAASSTTADDEHDPEGATVGFERAQAQALLAQAEAHLRDIDSALSRVADGTYGDCTRCGDRIADERLEARPEATLCIRCASRSRPPR